MLQDYSLYFAEIKIHPKDCITHNFKHTSHYTLNNMLFIVPLSTSVRMFAIYGSYISIIVDNNDEAKINTSSWV